MNKRVVLVVLSVALVVGAAFLIPVARLALVANRQGFFESSKPKDYLADRERNLDAIRVALNLTYESEGQFPEADKWMDALFTRMKTDDLTESSAKEKFHRPDVPAGKFGYAFNRAAAGKIKKDLPPGTVLVYECTQADWNASGDPGADRIPDGRAITVEGMATGNGP